MYTFLDSYDQHLVNNIVIQSCLLHLYLLNNLNQCYAPNMNFVFPFNEIKGWFSTSKHVCEFAISFYKIFFVYSNYDHEK